MITMKTDITVEPLTGALGAEVQGLDLNHLDDATWEQVHSLLLEHLVLFFPQQALTPDAHIALGRRFGEVEIHPFLRKVSEEYPEIVEIDSDKGPAEGWHTDATFSPTPPRWPPSCGCARVRVWVATQRGRTSTRSTRCSRRP